MPVSAGQSGEQEPAQHLHAHLRHPVAAALLADELGRKEFNPPSLRGVSQGRRYFHDNRAVSLSAVFTEHGHGLQSDLTLAELADLMRFLRSL